MQSVSPVFTEAEVQFEREIAKNQPEYSSVIGLPVTLQILDRDNPEVKKEVQDWAISIRFRLSDEERAAIAAGLDLVVTQLTFGKPLAPMNLQFCEANTKPLFEMRDEPPAPAAEQGPHCPGCMKQQAGDPEPQEHQTGTLEHPKSNLFEMPTNQTEQPAPEGDQPQSEV